MQKIFLLPGMGADGRMYPGPWRSLPGVTLISWPPYRGEESIDAVVWRVVAEYNIDPGSLIVGSSLGGMIGCEIANRVDLRGLVLVGSASHPSEVSQVLAALHPLANVVPFGLLQTVVGKLPTHLGEMFRDADPEFVRSMCHAIFKWEGLKDGMLRPLRIHGGRDSVIPCPQLVDLRLDAGHLVAMTHARECVEFIRQRYEL